MALLSPILNTVTPDLGFIGSLLKSQRNCRGWSPSITEQAAVTTWPEFNATSPNENGWTTGGTKRKASKLIIILHSMYRWRWVRLCDLQRLPCCLLYRCSFHYLCLTPLECPAQTRVHLVLWFWHPIYV